MTVHPVGRQSFFFWVAMMNYSVTCILTGQRTPNGCMCRSVKARPRWEELFAVDPSMFVIPPSFSFPFCVNRNRECHRSLTASSEWETIEDSPRIDRSALPGPERWIKPALTVAIAEEILGRRCLKPSILPELPLLRRPHKTLSLCVILPEWKASPRCQFRLLEYGLFAAAI